MENTLSLGHFHSRPDKHTSHRNQNEMKRNQAGRSM
ncbi:hypothetical protein EVA_11685 [gut metagenome]|uniref:Uncharacterized protein n=1 Tax=gut metagenome TaxID=749906 RepID=J9GKK8_9ZZZZ